MYSNKFWFDNNKKRVRFKTINKKIVTKEFNKTNQNENKTKTVRLVVNDIDEIT